MGFVTPAVQQHQHDDDPRRLADTLRSLSPVDRAIKIFRFVRDQMPMPLLGFL